MFYHILYPLVRVNIIFNVFQYITFRAIGAFVTALILCFYFWSQEELSPAQKISPLTPWAETF